MTRRSSVTNYAQLLYPHKMDKLTPTINELAEEFIKAKSSLPFVNLVKQNLSNTYIDSIQ